MRVTLDSNAWEEIFDLENQNHSFLKNAFVKQKIQGLISEAAFRIEAIQKKVRATYFAKPHTEFRLGGGRKPDNDALMTLFSFGPDDRMHPGLPERQGRKFREAIKCNIKLMRSISWMGLPTPAEFSDAAHYVVETHEEFGERELRQAYVFDAIRKRGVGRAAFEANGGWALPPEGPANKKEFSKACAEWADAELVSAHIAYRNDVLCTNDRARSSGHSVFDDSNRSWLAATYGLRLCTLDELLVAVT